MISKTTAALVCVLALLAAPLAAQPAAKGLKVAIIDVQRILDDSARGKQATERLIKEQDQRRDEATRLNREIGELQKRFNEGRNSLAPDKLKQINDEIDEKSINLKRYGENAQRDLMRLEREVMTPLEEQLRQVIDQLGKEQGYTLIFRTSESGLIFADVSVDITNLAIQRFDAASAAKPAVPAKP